MRVRILSRPEIESGAAIGADAVISIRANADGKEPELDLALAQATRGESARLMRLRFDDIGVPAYSTFVGPTIVQVQEVIDFGRAVLDGRGLFDGPVDDPLVVVHCEHGRSRSSAVALVLLAYAFGEGREQDAVNELLRDDVEVRLHPNPLIVSFADSCLFRYGRIDAALAEQCPRYGKWRQFWRDVEIAPGAYDDKIRSILRSRSKGR